MGQLPPPGVQKKETQKEPAEIGTFFSPQARTRKGG